MSTERKEKLQTSFLEPHKHNRIVIAGHPLMQVCLLYKSSEKVSYSFIARECVEKSAVKIEENDKCGNLKQRQEQLPSITIFKIWA